MSVYGPVISDHVDIKGVSAVRCFAQGCSESIQGQPLALRWTTLDPVDTTYARMQTQTNNCAHKQANAQAYAHVRRIVAFEDLTRATNHKEFCGALKSFVAPSQNFIFASFDENAHPRTAYQTPGLRLCVCVPRYSRCSDVCIRVLSWGLCFFLSSSGVHSG